MRMVRVLGGKKRPRAPPKSGATEVLGEVKKDSAKNLSENE